MEQNKIYELAFKLSLEEIIKIDDKELRINVLNIYMAEISEIERTNVGKYVIGLKRGWTLYKVLTALSSGKRTDFFNSQLSRFLSIEELEKEILLVEQTDLSLEISNGDVITFLDGFHGSQYPYDLRYARYANICSFCKKTIYPRSRISEFRPFMQNHSDHLKRGTISKSIYTCEYCITFLPENIRELETLNGIANGLDISAFENGVGKYEEFELVELYHNFHGRMPDPFWFRVSKQDNTAKEMRRALKKEEQGL